MRDILIALLALLVTGFVQSCTSSESKSVKSEEIADVSQANDTLDFEEVAIPDLYQGMAESQENNLGGLKVGEKAPNIIGTTSDGIAFNLHDEIKDGPVAVIFYRGFWCGKCTRHLDALQGEMTALREKGLRVYAVTPETDEYISKTKEKTNSNIPFIHDDAHEIMDDYKVTYKVTDDYAARVGSHAKVGLAKSQGGDDAFLPVPATYMIGADAKIFYAHYDHNYGNRATAADMLSALKTI